MNLYSLPEECISTILSRTTPRDVCRCSTTCSTLRNAAESNIAWEPFLPSDYNLILISPLQLCCKKELYFHFCQSILISNGRKSFWLERSTGKKCYMLGARELSIPCANNLMYWKPFPQSRFSEVVELRSISSLQIQGKINVEILSPMTMYTAYLIFNVADGAYGLDSIPAEVLVEMGGNHVSAGNAYLQSKDNQKQYLQGLFFANRMQVLKSRVIEGDRKVKVPCCREDGWLEIELGEFFVEGGEEGIVNMSLMEVKGEHLKGGLIVEGIEVRPLSIKI